MNDRPDVEPLGDHNFLVRLRDGDDTIQILVYASPAIVSSLSLDDADEGRVVHATVAYLVARQSAQDLPPQLDLDEVAAAYGDYLDDLRAELTGRT